MTSTIRVVLVPSGAGPEFVSLPPYKSTQLLVNSGAVYELNRTNFKDPHNQAQKLTKTQQPLKTVYLAATDARKASILIGNSCDIWVATKFNPVYLLLDFFTDALKHDRVRMVSYQDLLEQFETTPVLAQLLEHNVSLESALLKICESVDENDERFYRPSIDRILEFLRQRTTKLASNLPASIINSTKKKLSLPGFEPPVEVLAVKYTQLAIGLLESAVEPVYLEKLRNSYSSKPLDDYMVQYAQKEKMNAVAQENISLLHGMSSSSSSKKRKVEKKEVRKEVKRVAVGKGALDSFFKKKP
ncbi:hypothetical protein OGAPHI_001549 [Ogataea philodendri]|uniref:Ribonuclease H2 subunit B wHTH domain-containing protein n=1 Tax=Ogataea philodendri TaxID=1378263 RepID=A0A9P8PBW8_9ASCO|nr:uncharacterized protein OGAPHI_001549 [Ogataea philodendri]KAH3669428.1 hypothetical protein OGAPHI_001549 [Ogataea philodendri]